MRYELIIDPSKEEKIVITAHKMNDTISKIEKIINNNFKLIAYSENEIIPINLNEVYAFFTNNGKVYISIKDKEYLIKERLYQIEEVLDDSFIRINQSCIVNVNYILKFDLSLTSSIKVVLKNNFQDYISRREVKNVKRRLGLWVMLKNLF